MKIGLFTTIQTPAGEEHAEVRRFVDRAVRAEALGFDSIWLAERHFTPYGMAGNPAILAAAIAARTSRIDIGFAALILPMHNPYRLADELVMLNTLANGRLIAGVGTGQSRVEFGALGVPIVDLKPRFDEALDVLLRVLAGDPFIHDGPAFPATFPGLTLKPGTLRIVRAAVSDDSILAAARRGLPILLGSFSPEMIAQKFALYRSVPGTTLDDCGFVRYVTVGDTAEEADRIARESVAGYIERSNIVEEYHQPEAFLAQRCIVGTADTVVERIRALAPLGAGRLLCSIDFGGMPSDLADEQVERFGTRVLPHVATAVAGTP